MENATLKLAELVSKTSLSDFSPEVIKEAKRRIADVIGIGLSGSTTEVAGKIGEFSVKRGGPGKAVIWGIGAETRPDYAALANGTMTFHLELDDVHRTSHTHPGVSVIPAALALCEEYGLSGRELIESVVLGYDVVIRVGLAVSPSIYVDRTFLAPGTLGVLGAAAAVAKLRKLDIQNTADVIGTATYLGPLAPFESFRLGAGSKDTVMGWANFVGLNAAELTAYGFGGPKTAIEGNFGYCKTTSEHYDLKRIFNGLGSEFEILNTGIKPYACCRQHHAAIDAVLELREKYGLKPEDIKSVTNRTFAVASRGNQKKPTTIPEAKYSAPYIIAVTLKFGKAWREQFNTELIKDPEILELASKVEVKADDELNALYDEKWPSIIEVTTTDGRQLTARRDLPKGEPEFPVSDEELKEKFISLASDAVTLDRAEQIWEMIFDIENLDNVSELTSLLKNNR